MKASTANLAHLLVSGATAGTTVAATAAVCSLPELRGRIRAFATGGIGGVHRHWQQRPDVSADLAQLARTPICVVCSGPKSLLDVPATLEMLEALGVPLVGFNTDRLPRFLASTGDERLAMSVNVAEQAAALCAAHWDDLGRDGAVLLVNPTPAAHALEPQLLEEAIEAAEARMFLSAEAGQRGIGGADRTPAILAEIARLTDGRSLAANVALLESNAAVAAAVAAELAELLS